MHKKLIIIGANGQGKVVADVALKMQKYEEISFLDDDDRVKECMGFAVIGKVTDAVKYIEEADFFVAIGNTKIRMTVTELLRREGATIPTLIHPSATIGMDVSVGEGTVVMAGAVINPGVIIGQGCIINTCSSIDHDCKICDYVHISVGTHLAGTVSIGSETYVGAGAIISNNKNVIAGCMIGAGAVVVKDIEESGVYVGVPARKITKTV